MNYEYSFPLSIDRKKDRFISFAIAFQFVLLGCKNVLVQVIPLFYDNNDKLNLVILGLSSILYAMAFCKSFSRKTGEGFSFFAVFIALSFACTYLFFPQNIEFLNAYILRTLICCLFTGYLISKLRTLEWFVLCMLKGSYIITFSLILFAFEVMSIGHITTSDWSTYSMSMSNVGLIAIMFQFHDCFKNRNWKSLLFAMIGCYVIFLYGSRNAFLGIVCYLLLQFFDIYYGGKKILKSVLLCVYSIIIGVFLLFFNQILIAISSLLHSYGLGSRTLYYLINEDGEDITTGRNEIHNKLWNIIFDNPFGLGIAGDEAQINELAHGLYISIFCTYGIIIGTVFLIDLLMKCYFAHKVSSGINHQILVLYMCLVFPRGFTGGDMWQSDVFWWMMGIVFFILTNRSRLKTYKA